MAAKSRRLGQVDLETGEMMPPGVLVHIAERRHIVYGKDWMTTYQPPWLALGADRGIGLTAWRVIAWVISTLGWDNWLDCSPTKIAKDLGLSRPNVSRALTQLEAKEVLVRGGKGKGGCRRYRLAPIYAWRGRAAALSRELDPELLVRHRPRQRQDDSGVG